MSEKSQILVATHSKPILGLVRRLAQSGGLSVSQIEPTERSIIGAIHSSSGVVVVLDVIQQESDWLPSANSILEKCPNAKLVAFGRRPDLAVLAKAVVGGISHYLLDNATSEQFVSAVRAVIGDKAPSDDTMFGRVWSAIPSPPNKEGMCRTPSGQKYLLEEAIKHCDQLGLSVDEIARLLKVSSSDLQAVLEQSRKAPHASLFSRLPVPRLSSSAERPQGILLASLAILAVLWGAVSAFRSSSRAVDNFLPLKGTASYEDGASLGETTVLMFGLDSPTGKETPSYSGVTEVDGATGAFSTVLRLSHDDRPPYIFKVAILGKSLLPLEASAVDTAYSDLTTTPLSIKTSGEAINVRCPKPR